jgi:phospholipid-translocating ATPase
MGTDLGGIQEDPEEDEQEQATDERNGQGPRTIYFNQPLPADLIDEEGRPVVHYRRNKIRTAKYTAISFVPKNIWYQFHNIANVYFLFLIILAVSAAISVASQTLTHHSFLVSSAHQIQA